MKLAPTPQYAMCPSMCCRATVGNGKHGSQGGGPQGAGHRVKDYLESQDVQLALPVF